jgi:aminoglycoside 3-N-acetyltransferase
MEMVAAVSDARTQEEIADLLMALAIPRDGVVLIHSAFKGLSRAGYRAESVLAALVEYMSPGTLLMPTMSWRAVNPENPLFDELETPSITGILTEMFRTGYATRRSLHPTHSVAGRGRLTDDLLAFHHLDEKPCWDRSPWGLLDDYDAHVLLLGAGMESCTLVHHVEQAIAPELYLAPQEARERYICRDCHGREIQMYTRRTLRLPRNFWQFEEMLAAEGKVREQMLAGTLCRGFAAKQMVRVVADSLRHRPDAIIAKAGERYRMM